MIIFVDFCNQAGGMLERDMVRWC